MTVSDSHIDNQGTKIKVYLDEGANGTNSSLCTEFELPAELEYAPKVLELFIEGDITPYEGITLFMKMKSEAAKFEEFKLLLVEHGSPLDPEDRPLEVYAVRFPKLGEEWTRMVVPFTAFELHSGGVEGIVNRIFDLPEVNFFFTFFCVEDWQAGDKIKI